MAHGIIVRIINNWFETKHKFIFILFAIYELIFLTFLNGKNVTICTYKWFERLESFNKIYSLRASFWLQV